jgi:hypothetical protein
MDVDADHWTPRCELPATLVRPVRTDAGGVTGPTRHQAEGLAWRATGGGWHVPSSAPTDVVEQRILEQGMRVRRVGAVTAWAALRWYGARYFEGVATKDGPGLPVPLLRRAGGRGLSNEVCTISRVQLPPYDRVFHRGLWCTTPRRAMFDEVVRVGSLRGSVVAVCMAVAAGVTTLDELGDYAERRYAWTGIPLFRDALILANECFRSPPEVWMYLRWILDAGLPTPLINPPVFSRSGRLLGFPDLFDVEAGVVGEYDGADHLRDDRRRRDSEREERFRDHGLEYFRVVKGELTDDAVVHRMHSTRQRARFLPVESCAWTLDAPAWWEPPPWLPERYRPARAA